MISTIYLRVGATAFSASHRLILLSLRLQLYERSAIRAKRVYGQSHQNGRLQTGSVIQGVRGQQSEQLGRGVGGWGEGGLLSDITRRGRGLI